MSTFVFSTSNWVKALIRIGTVLMISAVPGSFVAYYIDGAYSLAGLLVVSTIALLFGYIGYRGFILTRFLNHEARIADGHIHVSSSAFSESFPVVGAEIRFEDGIQIVSIFRNDGSLAFCVDYAGQDIEGLKNLLMPPASDAA